MLNTRPNGEVEVDVPVWLDWLIVKEKLCCCFRNGLFKEYDKALNKAVGTFEADMDLFRFIRRKRMHGFGLHFLLGKSMRAASAILAFSRPLRGDGELSLLLKDSGSQIS